MPDLLNTGTVWLASKLKSNASQSVTARRGSKTIGSSLTATYGSTQFQQDSQVGIITWESKDFLITAADYTIDSTAVEPERGDQITDHLGNVFRVLGDNDLPPFKYADPFRKLLRIHTKQDA